MFVFQTSTLEHKTSKASFSFPRQARITRGVELQRIVREGKRIRTVHLEVRTTASPFAYSSNEWNGPRVGLIIPRFKHSAVARNRLKRRLRELTRLQILPTLLRLDVVVRIRPEAYSASFVQLTVDVTRAIEQLKQWYALVAITDEELIQKPDTA